MLISRAEKTAGRYNNHIGKNGIPTEKVPITFILDTVSIAKVKKIARNTQEIAWAIM